MNLMEVLEQEISENPIYIDAFLVSLIRKHKDPEYIDKIRNPVFKYNAYMAIGESKEVSVDKSDLREALTFSFAPIINYYLHKEKAEKIENMIEIYKKNIFGDLILVIAHQASEKLFDIFLQKFGRLIRTTNGSITLLLGLDEILFRFTIDEALSFVAEKYNTLDLEDKPYQIRQAAFSSYAHAMKLISGEQDLCSKLIEMLSIDSKDPLYFKLYPLLAKNIYGCGFRDVAIELFSSMMELMRLSIETTGIYRFIAPPSPRSLTYVINENLQMIRELSIKIEDLTRSKKFTDYEPLLKVLQKISKLNSDPRYLLLTNKLGLITTGNLNKFVDSLVKIIEGTPEDDIDVIFLDLGKILAYESMDEETYDYIIRKLGPSRIKVGFQELARGFYIEALKVYRI